MGADFSARLLSWCPGSANTERAAQICDDRIAFLVRSGTAEKMHFVGAPACSGMADARQVDAGKATSRRAYRQDFPASVRGLVDQKIDCGFDGRAADQTVNRMANGATRGGGPHAGSERTLKINGLSASDDGRCLFVQLQIDTALHVHTQTHTSRGADGDWPPPSSCSGTIAADPLARNKSGLVRAIST